MNVKAFDAAFPISITQPSKLKVLEIKEIQFKPFQSVLHLVEFIMLEYTVIKIQRNIIWQHEINLDLLTK